MSVYDFRDDLNDHARRILAAVEADGFQIDRYGSILNKGQFEGESFLLPWLFDSAMGCFDACPEEKDEENDWTTPEIQCDLPFDEAGSETHCEFLVRRKNLDDYGLGHERRVGSLYSNLPDDVIYLHVCQHEDGSVTLAVYAASQLDRNDPEFQDEEE